MAGTDVLASWVAHCRCEGLVAWPGLLCMEKALAAHLQPLQALRSWLTIKFSLLAEAWTQRWQEGAHYWPLLNLASSL